MITMPRAGPWPKPSRMGAPEATSTPALVLIRPLTGRPCARARAHASSSTSVRPRWIAAGWRESGFSPWLQSKWPSLAITAM